MKTLKYSLFVAVQILAVAAVLASIYLFLILGYGAGFPM